MHISIICFSLTGYTTAEKIKKSLQQCGYTADLFKKSKYLEDSIAENTAVWTGHHFKTDDGLIFVGALPLMLQARNQIRRCWWSMNAENSASHFCPDILEVQMHLRLKQQKYLGQSRW